MSALPEYEAYAVRYATTQRRSLDNFLARNDLHDGPMALDFYFWLLRGHGRNIVVDTGFSAASARARNRRFLLTPCDALAALGLGAGDIGDVVLTHLHYDHAGNLDLFDRATIHVQEAEMAYATGRCMCFAPLRHFFSADDVAALVRQVYAERVRFHDGSAALAPGMELHRIGGHTPGLQIVRVHTARGWVVLASDALHYRRNLADDNPFPAIYNLGDMLHGYERLRAMASTEDHIVPGHDPEVARRYPEAAPGIYRLDFDPQGE